ncbi:hypothetical protein F2P81_013084 [Scophthalmus maximus]|uniref:Uncharacterized protein n=1 Tax=Scophthalmus maximus TaxID=52904 RepID=A0A6A4SJF9_SCOMX|nr:hypothetical protein F2P81_013084 [Scophthalmus maximus]
MTGSVPQLPDTRRGRGEGQDKDGNKGVGEEEEVKKKKKKKTANHGQATSVSPSVISFGAGSAGESVSLSSITGDFATTKLIRHCFMFCMNIDESGSSSPFYCSNLPRNPEAVKSTVVRKATRLNIIGPVNKTFLPCIGPAACKRCTLPTGITVHRHSSDYERIRRSSTEKDMKKGIRHRTLTDLVKTIC